MRTGSDRNYQQIPHRVQHIVLPLFLPEQDSLTTLKVSHVVDQGDLAFVLNTRGRQWFTAGENVTTAGPGTLPLFANLACVNYMLACMQVAPARAAVGSVKRNWTAIRAHLWPMYKTWHDDAERELVLFACADHTVQELMKPHGVCAGSEKQGGQHEETWSPVQAAVNYTTTMTVDGQNRDLVNYWQEKHVCEGDRLLLRLELFNSGAVQPRTEEVQLLHGGGGEEEKVHEARFGTETNGYWQIAQSFQGQRGFDAGARARATDRGAPLQVTFATVWVLSGAVAGDLAWDWEQVLESFGSVNPDGFGAMNTWMTAACGRFLHCKGMSAYVSMPKL